MKQTTNYLSADILPEIFQAKAKALQIKNLVSDEEINLLTKIFEQLISGEPLQAEEIVNQLIGEGQT